jgi:hypothetical protein
VSDPSLGVAIIVGGFVGGMAGDSSVAARIRSHRPAKFGALEVAFILTQRLALSGVATERPDLHGECRPDPEQKPGTRPRCPHRPLRSSHADDGSTVSIG